MMLSLKRRRKRKRRMTKKTMKIVERTMKQS
jgi:hypothetical protein